MVATAIVAAAAPSPAPAVLVTDGDGAPLAAAAVAFVEPDGTVDRERTGSDGRAVAAHRDAVRALVAKNGYVTVRVLLGGVVTRVVLERTLPTVGRVSVATGTARDAHQLPVATSLLDATAIADSPVVSSDRLLRELPGADFTRSNSAFTNYGQLRASFSGAGEDRGIVLVDGFPAQDGFGGQIDWQAYPAPDIVGMELLRGAGSALYGSGGIGGVLNVLTFAPRVGAAQTEGDVAATYGTNADQNVAILASTPVGEHVAASIAQVDSRFAYLDLAPGYQSMIDHPALAADGATDVRARYAEGTTTLDVAGLFASDGQDEGRPNYTFDRDLHQATLALVRTLGNDASASVGFYSRDTTIYNDDDEYPTKPGVLRYIQHVPTHEDGFYATAQDTAGPIDVTLRVDQRRVDGSSDQVGATGALQALGTGVELMQGVAVQATYESSRAEILVGVRADRLRYDDLSDLTVSSGKRDDITLAGHDEGALSPRAAARYDVTKRLAIRASGGGGFRGPYLNELVRGFQIGKIVEAPNPHLDPERSTSYSGGLDYLLGGGRLSFDAVQTRVRDAITFATVDPTLMMRENFGGTQTQSETLAYAQPLGSCARARLSGTTQTPLVTSGPAGTAGKQIEYVPKASIDLGIDADGRGAFGYSVDGSYVGQTFADSLEQEPLGAALLFGGTLRETTPSGTTFELTGDNLTHQAYLTSIDRFGPPLTIGFSMRVPLGSPASPARCR